MMAPYSLEGVRIAGISACVPERAVANDEKVSKATGIVTRRIAAAGTTVVDLCVKAAERVLSDVGAKPEEFGAILCVSFTQRDRMPCAACQAQARLGFPGGIVAFDVSLACSGWGYGLYLAGLLARETEKKVLLLDGDVQSAFTGGDASTTPLLGDAGTATVVEAEAENGKWKMENGKWENGKWENGELWKFSFFSDGAKGGALKLEDGGTIEMDGFGVFQFVATDVVARIREFLSSANPPIGRSDDRAFTFVPHQPNAYMVRQLAKGVGVDETKTAISCDELGNLSSASVPATIAWKGVRGRILFAGFGGGLSISVGLIGLDDACRLSIC